MPSEIKTGKLSALLILFLLLGTGFLSWWMAQAPAPLNAQAPKEDFSAERALEHIKIMAKEPHPASSHANDRVFEYLLDQAAALGLEIEVIDTPFIHEGRNSAEWGRAILGRIRGTDSTKAFAMDAHFDSVPYGSGAADDLSGIATMLETARALQARAPLKNDLIFVFADQEEVGANGAKAFRRHPWFNDVGVMLGLETRGVCGPALMFETSQNNGKLIRELKKSGVSARANSIMFSVYDRLPFGSDFGQYKRAVPGYNVAYIDGFGYYHTRLDNPEKISLASLQHHGDYALGLALHLGNMDLNDFYEPNATFFNPLGSYMIVYPQSWDNAFTFAALVLLVIALVINLKKGGIRICRFLAALLVTVLTFILAALPGLLSLIAFVVYREASLYQNTLYCLGIIVAGMGIILLIYGLTTKLLRATELLGAVLCFWALLLYPAHSWLAGGAHIVIWPMIFGSVLLLVLGLLYREGKDLQPGTVLLLTLPLLPVLAFLVPLLQMLSFTLTPMGAVLINLFLVIIAGLFATQIQLLVKKRFLLAGGTVFLAGLLFFGWGLAANRPGPDNSRLNSLAYAVNFDSGEAWWLSADRTTREWFKDIVGRELPKGLFENESPLDEWTSQFFPTTDRAPAPEFRRGDMRPYLKAKAPDPNFEPFTMEVLEDRREAGKSRVTMHIASPRLAGEIALKKVSAGAVYSAALDGEPIAGKDESWSFHMNFLPARGATLTLEVDADDALRFFAREESWVLPVFEQYKPRTASMAAEPNRVIDYYSRLHSEHCYSLATVVPKALPPEIAPEGASADETGTEEGVSAETPDAGGGGEVESLSETEDETPDSEQTESAAT